MENVREMVAALKFNERKALRFEILDFGENAILEFEPSATYEKSILKLEQCAGLSMSYGLKKAIERVVMIDINPMLGNLYCTIMFNNDRTARIMCKSISIE
jgi:hypothetical protein